MSPQRAASSSLMPPPPGAQEILPRRFPALTRRAKAARPLPGAQKLAFRAVVRDAGMAWKAMLRAADGTSAFQPMPRGVRSWRLLGWLF